MDEKTGQRGEGRGERSPTHPKKWGEGRGERSPTHPKQRGARGLGSGVRIPARPETAQTIVTVPEVMAAKGVRRLVMVTATDEPSSRLADAAGVDLVLVGDSLAMAALGRADTLSVTM
ncbi:MAG: panB, partial [Anaeromyxobacteraceae bacterium]|nr:panB [Anaeromyxobacteraceae bacterium]